ncbi:Uncharacterised protein [Yersinia intermedia]|uniref:hypothetical protein n=1 Tax=Yersinia intermedia TaxID=631 RepID=UPI0005E76CAD|nr:hypothetical protein [Yersinia intermedia]CNC78781.1 Uncharacterised protein [Yersinia intermedia]CNH25615.1 Uncharacterised protein [Yersinia intermedia]
MIYQNIRLLVSDDFIELCKKNNLELSFPICFSAATTANEVVDFLFKIKDTPTIAILAYVIIEWLKSRKGRSAKLLMDDNKIKSLDIENVTKKELEEILAKVIAIHTQEND